MRALAAAFRQEAARIAATPIDLIVLTLFPLVLLGLMTSMLWGGTLLNLPVVIVDHDGGPLARALSRNIEATPSVHVVTVTPSREEALSMLRSETAVAFLVIPPNVGNPSVNHAPVEVFYEAVFLSTGALASTNLEAVAGATLAEQSARRSDIVGQTQATRSLPTVQLVLLGNPTLSPEWYLGLLIGPAILHLVVAISCIGSLGVLLRHGSFRSFVRATPQPAASLAGRLAVHVLAGTAWGIAWLLWMTLARGYRVEGSIIVMVVALALLFVATAALAILFLAVARDIGTAFSAAVIVAGSALAYSGATLPLTGGLWWTQDWSQMLPLTHFLILQMDQLIGVTPAVAMRQISTLLLYPLIAGTVGMVLILQSGRRA